MKKGPCELREHRAEEARQPASAPLTRSMLVNPEHQVNYF